MKITFLGAAREVTGSCTLIETCGRKILVDCGMEQGADTYENCELTVSPTEIDAVLLTHAHIDHSGKIPYLVKNGFQGPIYATEATGKLSHIMLLDSAHIQEFEAGWRNRKARRSGEEGYEPLYTTADAMKTLEQFKVYPYNKEVEIFEGIKIKFYDAGHLLGSASIYVAAEENGKTETVLFSGDLGNINRPLIRDPQIPCGADTVIIESTYGNRIHGKVGDYESQLVEVIKEALSGGGNVVIPAFAVGRTQELLYLIREIKEKGRLSEFGDFPVYVDSPMAVEATKIYSGDIRGYLDDNTVSLLDKGVEPINFKGLKMSVTSDDSILINADKTPKVILSASGMCEAGRIRHHLKHNLWRKESRILFVGYQSEGTMGRKLLDGATHIKLFSEDIKVNAGIRVMDGISGHADKNMLLSWLKGLEIKPKRIFINHGEETSALDFAVSVKEETLTDTYVPYNAAVFDTNEDRWVYEGNKKKIEKKGFKALRKNPVFEKLLVAGRRLLSVIEKNKGLSNKELAKFTAEINEISDKWDR